MTVCDSARRPITPAQVWQLFPMPCSRSSAGPLPARTNARRWPWTTIDSRLSGGLIAPVHHAAVPAGLPTGRFRGAAGISGTFGTESPSGERWVVRRRRPLAGGVPVAGDEVEQSVGRVHHAQRVQSDAVEVAVVDHPPQLGDQRLPEPVDV